MKKRILLLTQWFEPEPTFKGLVFARELVARGFEVEVVTGFPNYPGGKIYSGYQVSPLRREKVEGIEVTRLALYPSHDASVLRRIANYGSFAFSAMVYCLFVARRPDVICAYQLPTTAIVAAMAKWFRGIPFVYDVQDMWPDTLRATDMMRAPALLTVVGTVANWTYRHADALVVNSRGFRDLLAERGVPLERMTVVLNWCDERSLTGGREGGTGTRRANGRFRILFAGNMGLAQALDAILDAAALLQTKAPNIDFVFIGSGVEGERLRERAQKDGLQNVEFLPRVPMNEVGVFLRQADALLVHLKDDPLFAITIPGKTQAYMAIGKPILMAAPGNAAELVRQAHCGVEATPEDATSIAEAAMTLAAMSPGELAAMGERGKSYYESTLALSVGVDRFTGVFERVIRGVSIGTPSNDSVR